MSLPSASTSDAPPDDHIGIVAGAHETLPVHGLPARSLPAVRALLGMLPVAVWAKDDRSRFIFANTACEALYGMPASYLIGRTDFDCPWAVNAIESKLRDDDAIALGRVCVDEVSFRPLASTPLKARVTRIPHIDGNEAKGLFAYATLHAGGDAEPRADEKVLAQQIARFAHEVRSPAAGIVGLARLLATDGSHNERQVAMIRSIGSAAEHLLALAGDLVDIGQARSGNLPVEVVPIKVDELLRDVLSWLRPRTDAKQIEISADVDRLPAAELHTDPVRLRQVLINLLSNAVRHTDHGRVELRTSIRSAADSVGRRRWQFDVIDTGEGIPYSQQAELFTPYTRRTIPRVGGGAGLGLMICRELVRAMGGELKFESTPGSGSHFSFDIEDRAPDQR